MDGGGYLRSLYSSVESQGMLFVLIWHSLSDASKAQILWILRLLVRTLFQKFLQRMLPGGDGAPGSRRQRLSGDREGDSHPAHPRGRHNGKLLPLHAPTSPSESNSPRNPRKTPLSVRFANAPDQSSIVDTHPTLVASQGLHKTPSPKHDLRRVLPAPQPNVSILRKDPSMPQSRSYNDLLPIFRHQAGRYPPHTFSSPLQDALKALVDVEASADWVPRSSSNGIRISVRESPNRKDGMPLVRGDGVISGDWGIEEVASAISSYQARAEWDKRFDSGSILCQYNPFESLAYLTQKGTFPVAGRDFLVVSATRIDAASQSAYIVSTSVDPSQLSEIEQAIYTPYHQKSKDSGFVRADLKLNGWILRRRDDGVAATYILDVDVKGSIPQSILRMIQTQSPMCILGISQYLGSHGPLPFLLRSHDALLPHRPVQLKKVSQSPRQIDAMVEAALAPSSPRESAPDAPENPKVSHGRLEGLVADSLVLCIPKSSHPGLDITIEPAQGIRIFRLASDPALAGVLSPHATHLLQIQYDPSEAGRVFRRQSIDATASAAIPVAATAVVGKGTNHPPLVLSMRLHVEYQPSDRVRINEHGAFREVELHPFPSAQARGDMDPPMVDTYDSAPLDAHKQESCLQDGSADPGLPLPSSSPSPSSLMTTAANRVSSESCPHVSSNWANTLNQALDAFDGAWDQQLVRPAASLYTGALQKIHDSVFRSHN